MRRILPVAAAAAVVLAGVAMPAVASADTTPSADLFISRLSIQSHGNTVTVTAIAKNHGPDKATPAVVLHIEGVSRKAIIRTWCTFNNKRAAWASDGDSCEYSGPMVGGRAGNIVELRLHGPATITATASVYDLDDPAGPGQSDDPDLSNNAMYRQRHFR